jgi:hypothetical protein
MRNDFFNDDNFDRHLTNVEKQIKRTWAAIIVIWAVGAVTSLAVLGALGYVAYHFLSKVW